MWFIAFRIGSDTKFLQRPNLNHNLIKNPDVHKKWYTFSFSIPKAPNLISSSILNYSYTHPSFSNKFFSIHPSNFLQPKAKGYSSLFVIISNNVTDGEITILCESSFILSLSILNPISFVHSYARIISSHPTLKHKLPKIINNLVFTT